MSSENVIPYDFVINFNKEHNFTWGYVLAKEDTDTTDIKLLTLLHLDAKERVSYFKHLLHKLTGADYSYKSVLPVKVYEDEIITIPKPIYSPTQNLHMLVPKGKEGFKAEDFVKTKMFQYLLLLERKTKVYNTIIQQQQMLMERAIQTMGRSGLPEADRLITEIKNAMMPQTARPHVIEQKNENI